MQIRNMLPLEELNQTFTIRLMGEAVIRAVSHTREACLPGLTIYRFITSLDLL